MEVKAQPYKALDVITKQPVEPGQYQIRVDGRLVGHVGYHNGARPLLHVRFSPIELREIETQVRRQLTPQEIGPCIQVGDVPAPVQSKEAVFDDFD